MAQQPIAGSVAAAVLTSGFHWTEDDWSSIEHLAREEREMRALVRSGVKHMVSAASDRPDYDHNRFRADRAAELLRRRAQIAERMAARESDAAGDFRVDDHGSILILTALTDEARAWRDEHLSHDEVQHWGRDGVVVEPRYIGDIVAGIESDGLAVVH